MISIVPAGQVGPKGDPGSGFSIGPLFVDFVEGEFTHDVAFDAPEPDADYLPFVQAFMADGNPAPVVAWPRDLTVNGFTIDITGDPGAGNTIRVAWAIGRPTSTFRPWNLPVLPADPIDPPDNIGWVVAEGIEPNIKVTLRVRIGGATYDVAGISGV